MPISSALGSSALSPAGLGFRNVIINGGMVIDQRYSGSSVTPSATQYFVDRWQYQCSVGSKMTVGQNLNSITPPTGFSKYIGAQTGASANVTVGSNDFYCINHYVEGYNTAQFAWGTSSAKQAVLSFWVRSSISGTHSIAIRNGANNRSYPVAYTINSANTWEYKVIYINGDITGTWATDNTVGFFITFNLGMGSGLSSTSGAWAGATYAAANGAQKVVETNNATFYLTGVQLEQNTQPTTFEQRPYGVELQLCQRYYFTYPKLGSQVSDILMQHTADQTTWGRGVIFHPVEMRTAPTLAVTPTAGNWRILGRAGSAPETIDSITIDTSNPAMTLLNTNKAAMSTNQTFFLRPSVNPMEVLRFQAEL